jgi:hypothetical protein
MKFFVALSAFVALCALSGCRHSTVVVERTEPAEPPPDVVVIQDGEPCDGAVFVPPPVIEEYVLVGGRYHYWHPGYHRWVEMRRGFRPPRGYRVRQLHSWRERPIHEGDKGRITKKPPTKIPPTKNPPGKTPPGKTPPGKTPPTKTPPGKTPPEKDKDKEKSRE